MNLHKIKCDVKGCDFVAEHKSPTYVRCIIGRHKSIIHHIRGKLYAYAKGLEAKKQLSEGRNSEVQETAPEPVNIPNFCPNCGCSMAAVTAAMNLRRRK